MRFIYNWLKDYVDVKLKPQELAEKLTMAGLEIESLGQLEGDWVFEAEVTTNRPDWLSIIGIAREVAAITGKKLKVECLKFNVKNIKHQTLNSKQISIIVNDQNDCLRYTGRVINNVKVGPSPEWLQKRLASVGLRPVNNIVDITNFVLFETGQPLHAFDFDKLAGGKIIVRRAKTAEEIVTIDGIKRVLNPDILVIADQGAPVAIAGIMGGKDTEVTEATKNVLLESAYFDPIAIRRTSKSLSLSSDSSYRFERGVDLDAVGTTSDKAAKLLFELADGVVGELVDIGKKAIPLTKVVVRPQRLNDILGIEIPAKDITRILKSLGLKNAGRRALQRASLGTKLVFSVPSWRRDLKKEIDLIEEVARLYGYEKIPVAAPKDIAILDRAFVPKGIGFQAFVRDVLICLGLNEVLTFSLVDKDIDQIFQIEPDSTNISIKNPLSPELAALRSNLTGGILSSLRWNLNRNINDIGLFELGPVYSPHHIDKQEENHLAICISGNRVDNWQDGAKPADFYYLKGIIEGLFVKLGVEKYSIVSANNKILDISGSAGINIDEKPVGFFGKVKNELLNQIDIEKDCFICQINLDALIASAKLDRKFSPLPKFPPLFRDISMIVGGNILCGQLAALIKETAGNLVKDVRLFDVYSGQQIPKGHRSLAFKLTYQSPDKTLTDDEVEAVHSKIASALREKLAVGIR